MPKIKLAKLPERTPVKLTVTVSPDLMQSLKDYAEVYRREYGQKEPVEQLVPFMLEAFLASDRTFVRTRKELGKPASDPSANQPRE